MNSIFVIHPYKQDGVWVFDDPAVGLVQEPFVSGADVVMNRMAGRISNAERGVTVMFSSQPFPGYQHEFTQRGEEFGGNWYSSQEFGVEGWLCPALFKFFERPPERLYVQVKPKPP